MNADTPRVDNGCAFPAQATAYGSPARLPDPFCGFLCTAFTATGGSLNMVYATYSFRSTSLSICDC